jgi:hypothetical protein
MGSLIAIPAAVYVWKGIQDIRQGVQYAARSVSADTALRILYQHQPESPGTRVHETEPYGRVSPGITARVTI